MLNRIGSMSTSFEIILVNTDDNKHKSSEKICYTPNTESEDFSLTFSFKKVNFNKFNIYLLYLPRLTEEIPYNKNDQIIKYKTLWCDDEYIITISSNIIMFESSKKSPVERIYVIKTNGTNEIHVFDDKDCPFEFSPSSNNIDLSDSIIHLGVFEVMYPSLSSHIDDLNALDFNYSEVPSMNMS